MTRYSAPKLAGYATLSAVGLLAALVFAQPELVALAAPFLLAVGAGLALATPPRLSARIELDSDRTLEGDEVGARIVRRVARRRSTGWSSSCSSPTGSSSRTAGTR